MFKVFSLEVTLSGSWAAEISILKSGTSTLPTLQSEAFSDRVSIVKPIRVLIVVTKTESNCCELHLKTSEEDKEEKEMAATLSAAQGLLSMDAAIVAVLSELDGIHIKRRKMCGNIEFSWCKRSFQLSSSCHREVKSG